MAAGPARASPSGAKGSRRRSSLGRAGGRTRIRQQRRPSACSEPMTSIQPELWVESPREALAFYEAAFGAKVLHLVGEGDDIVAQIGVGDAAFWIASDYPAAKRLSPRAIDGATGRTLLVVEDPDSVLRTAVIAGARET